MRRLFCTLIVLAMAASVWAAPMSVKIRADSLLKAPVDSMPDVEAQAAPEAAKAKPRIEPDTITTEMQSVDSLGVLPNEVETPFQGGTRHMTIDKTVFHREHQIAYNSDGRRDPFRPLIVDEKKEGEIETDLLRIEGAILTGVVWSDGMYLAMVKDKDNHTFFLREGDPVYKGKVTLVTQSQVSFGVYDFDDYEETTLKIKVKA